LIIFLDAWGCETPCVVKAQALLAANNTYFQRGKLTVLSCCTTLLLSCEILVRIGNTVVSSSNALYVLWQDHKRSLWCLISDLIQIGDNAMPLNSKVGMGTEPENNE